MKVPTLIVAAGLASIGLAGAIPGHDIAHQKYYNARRDVTETVTTTFYQTIVWVDTNGKVVNTEVNTPPPDAATASTPAATTSSPPPASISDSSIPSANPADPGAMRRPNNAALPSGSSASQSPVSAQSTAAASKPAASIQAAAQPSGSADGSKASAAAPAGMGICYDMIDSSTKCKSQVTASSEFGFLKSQGYGIVHLYDIGCPVGDFVSAAAQNGLQLMIGINQIGNLQGDLGKLISMVNGQWNVVHTVYIGNELVNGAVTSADAVAGAVNQARGILQGAGYSGNVITIDTFNVMQSNPTVCSTSDYCAANAHAYFDPNTAAANAGNFVINAYNAVKAANGGKNVIITETGWPYQGGCNGQACPSIDNQKAAMNSIMKSFSGMPGNVFMFQAYNAGYKQPGSNGVEQFFGIYDSNHYTGGIGPA